MNAAFFPLPINLNGDINGTQTVRPDRTMVLQHWLSEHRKDPYPTKGEKIMLAIMTKMTLTQVSMWFANARRRLPRENKMTWKPWNSNDEEKEKVEDVKIGQIQDSDDGSRSVLSDTSDSALDNPNLLNDDSADLNAAFSGINLDGAVNVNEIDEDEDEIDGDEHEIPTDNDFEDEEEEEDEIEEYEDEIDEDEHEIDEEEDEVEGVDIDEMQDLNDGSWSLLGDTSDSALDANLLNDEQDAIQNKGDVLNKLIDWTSKPQYAADINDLRTIIENEQQDQWPGFEERIAVLKRHLNIVQHIKAIAFQLLKRDIKLCPNTE